MKNVMMILMSIVLIGCANEKKQEETHENHAPNAETSATPKSLSPHSSSMAMINGAHIHIDYSAPSVRERVIFGGLVGYNTVWQAGAHKATWIETDKDLMIDGKTLKAGKYGFFVIPGKEQWQVMFNSRWDQHGKDEYDEADNMLTMQVSPEELDENQEILTYEVIEKNDKEGIIVLTWEKIKIEVPFEVIN
ncbi:MAG TPA: DUF2911 domain-containing protein [Gillisia sp.]|nr:DUF2911 domain-containing protein [Gillisia sp.]